MMKQGAELSRRLVLLFSFVFLPGGHAAADMALGFVQVQQLPYLAVQCRIDL